MMHRDDERTIPSRLAPGVWCTPEMARKEAELSRLLAELRGAGDDPATERRLCRALDRLTSEHDGDGDDTLLRTSEEDERRG